MPHASNRSTAYPLGVFPSTRRMVTTAISAPVSRSSGWITPVMAWISASVSRPAKSLTKPVGRGNSSAARLTGDATGDAKDRAMTSNAKRSTENRTLPVRERPGWAGSRPMGLPRWESLMSSAYRSHARLGNWSGSRRPGQCWYQQSALTLPSLTGNEHKVYNAYTVHPAYNMMTQRWWRPLDRGRSLKLLLPGRAAPLGPLPRFCWVGQQIAHQLQHKEGLMQSS